MDILDLEKRIDEIEKRNKRVEKDKAWDTSTIRKLLIAVLTYFVVVLFFFVINVEAPYINALIPVIRFLLSTLSFSIVKKWWIENK